MSKLKTRMDHIGFYDALAMLVVFGILAVFSLFFRDWLWLSFSVSAGLLQMNRLVTVPPWWVWIHGLSLVACFVAIALLVARHVKNRKKAGENPRVAQFPPNETQQNRENGP